MRHPTAPYAHTLMGGGGANGLKSHRPLRTFAVAMVLCVLGFARAHAQSLEWGEEYAKRIKATQAVTPVGDGYFGENTSLFNGTTSFRVTDFSLAGNSSLPVEFTRVYDTQNVSSDRPLREWEIDTPRLAAVHPDIPTEGYWMPQSRCSTVAAPPPYGSFSAQTYWNGTQLAGVPGAGDVLAVSTDPRLVKPAGTAAKWTTKSRWFFTCSPQLDSGHPGEGFVGLAPDGTRYTFSWLVARAYSGVSRHNPSGPGMVAMTRKSVRIYATKVEDRFGNWVKYDWSGGRLNRIYSNDGREIVINYTNDLVTSVTAAGRTWTYLYSGFTLNKVQLPDGSQWRYAFAGTALNRVPYETDQPGTALRRDVPLVCASMKFMRSITGSLTITAPSGAVAAYTFAPVRHGRTNVPDRCIETTDGNTSNNYNAYSIFHDVMALKSKTISGPGLPGTTYQYRYENLTGGYAPSDPQTDAINGATPPPHYKRVTVTDPDGVEHVSVFGKDFGLNEGQLIQSITQQAGVTFRTTASTYVAPSESASVPYAPNLGSSLMLWEDEFNAGEIHPEKSTQTTQAGSTFSRTVLEFDPLARPRRVQRTGDL